MNDILIKISSLTEYKCMKFQIKSSQMYDVYLITMRNVN
jgi:hypothetical protein